MDGGSFAVGGLTVSGSTFNDTASGNAQDFGVFVGDVDGDVLFNDNGQRRTPSPATIWAVWTSRM